MANLRQQHIIYCTLSFLASKGYYGMSISQIATMANLGKSSLYYYFDTKEQLTIAALIRLKNHLGELLKPSPTLKIRSLKRRLFRLLYWVSLLQQRYPYMKAFVMLVCEDKTLPKSIQYAINDGFFQWEQALKQYLVVNNKESGNIRSEFYAFLTEYLMGRIIQQDRLHTKEIIKPKKSTIDVLAALAVGSESQDKVTSLAKFMDLDQRSNPDLPHQ